MGHLLHNGGSRDVWNTPGNCPGGLPAGMAIDRRKYALNSHGGYLSQSRFRAKLKVSGVRFQVSGISSWPGRSFVGLETYWLESAKERFQITMWCAVP